MRHKPWKGGAVSAVAIPRTPRQPRFRERQQLVIAAAARSRNAPLTRAVACLQIIALCWVLPAVVVLILPGMDWGSKVYIAGVLFLLTLLAEILSWGLTRRHGWARTGAIVLFVVSAFSIALPFAFLGLIGLLNPNVRAMFDRASPQRSGAGTREGNAGETGG